jgi:hypothetical protein
MTNQTNTTQEIKKLHVEAMVLFAINNIPQVDAGTLKQFLELVNANGSFGSISHEQILRKMEQVARYIPGSCANSLLILMDLLGISPQLAGWELPRQNGRQLPAFMIETPALALGEGGFYLR